MENIFSFLTSFQFLKAVGSFILPFWPYILVGTVGIASSGFLYKKIKEETYKAQVKQQKSSFNDCIMKALDYDQYQDCFKKIKGEEND